MATRARKSKKKIEPSPEEIKTPVEQQEQTTSEKAQTSVEKAADTLPPTPTRMAFEELLYIAVAAWRFQMIPKGILYKMTRTFAHHRNGEKYDSAVIFREMEAFQHGKHEQLLSEIDSFCDMVMDEAKGWVAAKLPKS